MTALLHLLVTTDNFISKYIKLWTLNAMTEKYHRTVNL